MEQTKQIQNTQTKLQTNVHTYIRTWQLFKQKKKNFGIPMALKESLMMSSEVE